ncbi:MAG: endonuclease MutS2 [Firmicutes bacterium]|nr:endonuclease MutS2 [Bacillota bacterium]
MDQKALKVLEYHKILEMLSAECCSRMGREEVEQLLPDSDASAVSYALEQTDEAVTVLLKKGMAPLGNFYDVTGLVHLAAREASLTMQQLLHVAYNLASARKTAEFLSSDLPPLPSIDNLVSAITVLKHLEDEITRCILSEDEMADTASPELRRIRHDILRINEAIRSKIQKIVSSSENQTYLQDAIVTMRQGRYVVPVKLEHRARVPGIVHDQSASGQTLFIEPQAIVDMNNQLRELELAEQKEINRILKELSGEVGVNEAQIRGNQQILLKLDVLFAKGRLACNMRAMKPQISSEGKLHIKKARHPLLDQKKVVPIDIDLGDGYQTLVITGPNTGGKTVTLKTVGLFCMMAQSGLFVPASDGTVLPVYKEIFADIGDEQSIEQSLSTFSSHMVNIVKIIEGAGEGSLVLLDELGAGTDPAEGAALAMAILDYLFGLGAATLATTHYTELKKYALSTEGVQNASMQFDVETLSPTYRLIIGIPGKSNAFEISRKLGLDENIISYAGTLLDTGDIAFEDVLQSIEDDRLQAKAELEEAKHYQEELRKQKARMDQLEKRFQQQKQELLEEARLEASELIDEAVAQINQLQKEVADARDAVESTRMEEASRQLNRAMEEGKKKLKQKKSGYAAKTAVKVPVAGTAKAEEIHAGMRVNVLSVGQKGSVLTEPDSKGDFMVQIGQMKLTVNVKGVTAVQENVTAKQREKTKYSRLYSQKVMSVPMSINVIGKNLDEAELLVDKYLDDAFMAGLESVSVIHGRGAGILRQGLQTMFRRHKHVASFKAASYNEGGEGCTIVTLKK